jgi:renalase
MTRIAIIGAGLSGLMLARGLHDVASVTVFEKSRGIGGRMSTRYQDAFSFDHGAQYFTAKTPEFRKFLEPHIASRLVQDWQPKLVTLEHWIQSQAVTATEGFYAAVPRMTSLCKSLAEDIDVQHQREIKRIERVDGVWHLTTSDGIDAGIFDWVISTAPALQTQRLLPKNFSGQDKLKDSRMNGCFTLMLGYENAPTIEWDAAKIVGSPIGWIAVNSSKSGRPMGFSLVVQTSNKWAEAHLEDPTDAIEARLMDELAKLTRTDVSGPTYTSLHRWRFASTQTAAGAPYLLDKDNRLAAGGDWCIRGRVEAAFTSARMLADAMRQEIG